MVKRRIGVIPVMALMFALVGCGTASDQQAHVETRAVSGEASYASPPGSPFPILSYDDRDAIGRVTYAEAGNQGEEGIAAVIFTILNRLNSGQFGDSVQEIVDARNQFEPATRVGGWRYLPPLDPWQSVQFETILNLILAGHLPDLTGGALFFQNAEIVARRAARGKVSSYLVDFGGTPPVAEIGDHRFYDWRAAINLAAWRNRAYEGEPAYSIGETAYDGGVYDPVAAEVVPEGTWTASEPSAAPGWDEQQSASAASGDAVISESWDAQPCGASYC
jgi:spore germination cell wall hydrolase CwlJ-like protein